MAVAGSALNGSWPGEAGGGGGGGDDLGLGLQGALVYSAQYLCSWLVDPSGLLLSCGDAADRGVDSSGSGIRSGGSSGSSGGSALFNCQGSATDLTCLHDVPCHDVNGTALTPTLTSRLVSGALNMTLRLPAAWPGAALGAALGAAPEAGLAGPVPAPVWARVPDVFAATVCEQGRALDVLLSCEANDTLLNASGLWCALDAVLGEAVAATSISTVADLDVTGQPYDWSFLFVLFFIVAGGVGNILVCLAVILDRRLQNVTNYFLLSLAIADLLVSLFVMPLGAIPGFLGKESPGQSELDLRRH